ncbi:MAG TPA: hypothetical protein PKD90_01330, partial [Phnomibacter sp.]|nr:hypothetical protein [Phnomibacter sp.]
QYLMRYNGTAMVIPQKFYLTLASQLPAETYNSCISSLARLEQCVQVPVNYIEIIEYKTGNKSCQLVQRFQLPEGNTMTNQPWYLPLHAAPLATAV